jgi:hypothetical protein
MNAKTAALIELIRLTECEETATIARQRALIKARRLVSWGTLAEALGVTRETVRGQYASAVRTLTEQENPNNEIPAQCENPQTDRGSTE